MGVKILTEEDKQELIKKIEENQQNGGSGVTQEQIKALDDMFKKCAFTGDVSAEYEAFKNAFGLTEGGEVEPDEPIEPDNPEVTLTSISATYTGGSVVAGTSVNSLTGITVKATYSDGSTKNVTGYTLSGTIAEGSNTITVSYQGKTTTFVVVGVDESDTTTVYFSNLELNNGKLITNAGQESTVTNGYYVQLPYVDGMFISTYIRNNWLASGFSCVVVYDNGKYSTPECEEMNDNAILLSQYTCTLSGYSDDAIVYVNMEGIPTDDHSFYSYSRGGEEL